MTGVHEAGMFLLYYSDWFIRIVFYGLLIGSAVFVWWGRRLPHRWQWTRIIALIVVACLLYGRLVEPRLLTVKTYQIPLVPQPQQWIKAVFLYDAHAGRDKGPWYYDRVAKTANSLKPDVIFVGGDFVDWDSSKVTWLEGWKNLSAPQGVYFVLGNHDYYDNVDRVRTYVLDTLKFKDLTNTVLSLDKGGRTLSVVGLDDGHKGEPDLSLLNGSRSTRPRIIFTHEADALLSLPDGEAELAIVGHTHGGQVRLPFFGTPAVLPQAAPQWLDVGLKRWKGMPIIISAGLGEATAPVRFFDPPQIVVVEIGI